MKIAFLISHPVPYYIPLFRKLSRHPQIDLTVYFCLKWGLEEVYDPGFGKSYKWDIPLLGGYKHIFLKSYNPKPTLNFFGQINPGIIKELRRNTYDAVIVHGYNFLTNWFAFLGCWLTHTPLIIKGEADSLRKTSPLKMVFKKLILTSLFKRVDAALYSYKLNKDFFGFYGVPQEKLFFYPCAVDNDFLNKEAERLLPKRNEIKKTLGIENMNIPTVIFSGKLIPRKRPMDLLEVKRLLEKKVDFNLVFVGDGVLREGLESFVAQHNLKNVYFTGFKNQSELPRLYTIADILALPSEYDPSPKVINEVLNFGVPVIASDGVGTASDIIDGEGVGFIFRRGDVDDLADNLLKVLNDSKLLKKLKENTSTAVKKWSFDGDIEGIIEAVAYVLKIKKQNTIGRK